MACGIILLVFLFLKCTWCQSVSDLSVSEGDLDDLIRAGLEEMKGLMKTGRSEYGMPRLDPWYVDKDIHVDREDLRLDLHVEGVFTNLSQFQVNGVHLDPDLNMHLDVTFRQPTFGGSYSMRGSAFSVVPIMGNGSLLFHLDSLNLVTTPLLSASMGFLKLNDLQFSYKEDNLIVMVGGLLEGEDLSELLKYFLNDVLTTAASKLKDTIQASLNSYAADSFNINKDGMNIFNVIETARHMVADL